ncbi:MAG: putative membrane protein [Porticoccaceae bacterium]|jgi:uncharacterized membrane protein
MKNQTINEGKIAAIISYFLVVGLIIAFVMNYNKKNSFASFHIRQMIGLSIAYSLNGWIVFPFLDKTTAAIITIILFILWVIGLIGAIKGEEKLVPVVGEQFQIWFKNI